jgi:hypothetical protein
MMVKWGVNSASATRHALRRTWIKQASNGERASLVGQWSLLQEELASDVAFADDLLIASMSKKGSPAFLWLCSVYSPSERVLRAGIARLSPDVISKALSGKPWPLGGSQVGLLGIEKALIQHPSGWKVALDNFNVCVNAGMPLPRDELYGVLYHLATSAPKKWMRLSSPNDNAIAGLIRAGVKVCEWPSRPRPEPGHALTAALECGNLVAATCLLSSTNSPFKVDYLDVLLGAVSGYPLNLDGLIANWIRKGSCRSYWSVVETKNNSSGKWLEIPAAPEKFRKCCLQALKPEPWKR